MTNIKHVDSVVDRDFRNRINQLIDIVNGIGTSLNDLVVKGVMTAEQYSQLLTTINGLVKIGEVNVDTLSGELKTEIEQIKNKVDKGNVSVADINKNLGKIDQTFLSEELLQQIAGTAPINAVVADNSVTTKKIVDKSVTPSKVNFFNDTKNLFDGQFYHLYVAGAVGNANAYLYTDDNKQRMTAIVPVKAGTTYTVKVHDPEMTNHFRIGLNATIPKVFDPIQKNAKIHSIIIYNDVLKEETFTSDINGYAFITLNNNSKEPRLQVEEGVNATPYISGRVLDPEFIPENITKSVESVVDTTDRLDRKFSDLLVDVSENLFDGTYHKTYVAGAEGSTGYLFNNGGDKYRTAIIPIVIGETYSIKVHDTSNSDAFRLAVHTKIPTTFDPITSTAVLGEFIKYSDNIKEFTFVSEVTGYAFVTVSKTGKEPLLQFEKGDNPTRFKGYQKINEKYLQDSMDSIDTEPMPMFPRVANMEYIPTDPGARFIDYFDKKMWGYTASTGAISYSIDDGKSWTEYARGWNHAEWGWINRLMKTADGEVIAMTGTDLRKSSGWSTGNPTWSENKITKHAGADLFQFSLDGNGTKFIVCEYSGSASRWSDSRFVWISLDKGDTWKVVWDSLEHNGETLNKGTHLHAACYDRWGDRFYFSEGHGANGGLYCSTDDGKTWIQAKGYRDGVLKSLGLSGYQNPDLDTNGPTVIVATPTGLVMGSDNANNGMFGLVRKSNPEDEEVTITYSANKYRSGLSMFAIRGFYDEISDTVIITFRSEFDEVPPIICAGTPTKADLIYEYPDLPVRGAHDLFGAVAKTKPDRLVAYCQFHGIPYTAHADLMYPASEIRNLIYTELKRYNLV